MAIDMLMKYPAGFGVASIDAPGLSALPQLLSTTVLCLLVGLPFGRICHAQESPVQAGPLVGLQRTSCTSCSSASTMVMGGGEVRLRALGSAKFSTGVLGRVQFGKSGPEWERDIDVAVWGAIAAGRSGISVRPSLGVSWYRLAGRNREGEGLFGTGPIFELEAGRPTPFGEGFILTPVVAVGTRRIGTVEYRLPASFLPIDPSEDPIDPGALITRPRSGYRTWQVRAGLQVGLRRVPLASRP